MNNNQPIDINKLGVEELKQLIANTYVRIGELQTAVSHQTMIALEISRLIEQKSAANQRLTLPKLKKVSDLSPELNPSTQATYEYNTNG